MTIDKTEHCYFCGKSFDPDRLDPEQLLEKLKQRSTTVARAGFIGNKAICKGCVDDIKLLIRGETREEWDFLR